MTGKKYSHMLLEGVIHRTSQPYMDSHTQSALSLGFESRDAMKEVVPATCRYFGFYLHLKV